MPNTNISKHRKLISILAIISVILIIFIYIKSESTKKYNPYINNTDNIKIVEVLPKNFKECISSGGSIQEDIYPKECTYKDKEFIEEINEDNIEDIEQSYNLLNQQVELNLEDTKILEDFLITVQNNLISKDCSLPELKKFNIVKNVENNKIEELNINNKKFFPKRISLYASPNLILEIKDINKENNFCFNIKDININEIYRNFFNQSLMGLDINKFKAFPQTYFELENDNSLATNLLNNCLIYENNDLSFFCINNNNHINITLGNEVTNLKKNIKIHSIETPLFGEKKELIIYNTNINNNFIAEIKSDYIKEKITISFTNTIESNSSFIKDFLASFDKKGINVPIFMYHYISKPAEDDPARKTLSVSKEKFEEQLKEIKDLGYKTISLYDLNEALKGNKEIDKKSIVLTFDDGYIDNYINAYPLLKKYKMTGTFFIVPGFIEDKSEIYMSWDNAKEMHKNNMDMEVHTMKHVDIRSLNYAGMQYQINNARTLIKEKLNKDAKMFAYPYGFHNYNNINFLTNNDYNISVTTVNGTYHTLKTRQQLPRIRIVENSDIRGILD